MNRLYAMSTSADPTRLQQQQQPPTKPTPMTTVTVEYAPQNGQCASCHKRIQVRSLQMEATMASASEPILHLSPKMASEPNAKKNYHPACLVSSLPPNSVTLPRLDHLAPTDREVIQNMFQQPSNTTKSAFQGMGVKELRDAGAEIRHARGINTCVRCHLHYFQASQATATGPTGSTTDNCQIHLRPLVAGRYPCCQGVVGSRGCAPAPHLPKYQFLNGKVDGTKLIEYNLKGDNLHVGRWLNTAVTVPESDSSATTTTASRGPTTAPSNSKPVRKVQSRPILSPSSIPQPLSDLGTPVPRVGDEIMVCGQLYHTGTPVILWGDVGGYDHYRVERRFCPFVEADWATTQHELPSFTTPNRFGLRKDGLTPDEIEAVRGGQWDLPTLSKQMKQFVFHYDEMGLSQQCFMVLQDQRDLSIHLMCDLDGTIYQALDLKERAWQATTSNTNSIGCEIANIGAYDPTQPTPFSDWYGQDAQGNTIITIPPQYGDGGIHTPGFVGSPARPNPIAGVIQGQNLIQYDYTPQQYAALTKLVATFCSIFPQVPCDYPKDASGNLIRQKLPDEQLATYTGLLGHFHIQTDKIDPGPAMQWDVLIDSARTIMAEAKLARHHLAPNNVNPAINTKELADLNLMRMMEQKLLRAAATETVASESHQPKPFYLIEGDWYLQHELWLQSHDASIKRPSLINNQRLLESDHRTPRTGLFLGQHYFSVQESIWKELIDLYGCDSPIIRDEPNIYCEPSAACYTSASAHHLSPPSYDHASSNSIVHVGDARMIGIMGEDQDWTLIAQ